MCFSDSLEDRFFEELASERRLNSSITDSVRLRTFSQVNSGSHVCATLQGQRSAENAICKVEAASEAQGIEGPNRPFIDLRPCFIALVGGDIRCKKQLAHLVIPCDYDFMIDFEINLAEIIGRPSLQRPFVCDGAPSTCSVWIVGYNAATSGGDWWRFWTSGEGFDLGSWRKDYDAERAARGKGPSATRRRIDRLSAKVPDVLETNIYATPSTEMANMPVMLIVTEN